MKNYLNIFSRAVTAATPQAQAIPNAVPNSAGGYAFAIDDWARLDRFLILGSEGGSYYAGERVLTRESAAGGVTLAVGLTLAALWPIHGNLWPLVGFLMLSSAGFGIFQTPNNRNKLLSAPRERSGAAGGMQGTARLLGQTLGSVIMTLLFTLTSAAAAPRIGLAVSAVFALAGGLVSVMRIRSVGAPDDALRLSSTNAA